MGDKLLSNVSWKQTTSDSYNYLFYRLGFLRNYMFSGSVILWRILDFPDGARNLLFGNSFAKKCLKMKEFGPEGPSLATL